MPGIPKPVPVPLRLRNAPAPSEKKQGKPAEAGSAAGKDEKAPQRLLPRDRRSRRRWWATFYSTSRPGKPKLVNVGDVVEAGTKVCIVEAMKLFNEIVAPVKCKILQFLVEDGSRGEDQPLIAIEAAK